MQSIRNRLIGNYVCISLFILVALESLFIIVIGQYYFGGIEQTLTNHLESSASFFSRYGDKGDIYAKSNFIFENMDMEENALVEVVDLEGAVIIDNTGFSAKEVVTSWDYVQALTGKTSVWRGRTELGERIIAVSAPIYNDNEIVGVLRYVSSLKAAYNIVLRYILFAVVVGLITLMVCALVGRLMSDRILVPIRELIRVTEEVSQGNFKVTAIKYHDDEIGQLVDAVNSMTREITKFDRAKNEFISSISHELRTPLTSIKGWAETISEALDEKEVTEMGMAIISKETDRLIVLVNDLLDFSKLQAQRIELKKEEFAINDLLTDIRNQFAVRMRTEKVKMSLILDHEESWVIADYNRLKQVLINIVDNGLKFTVGRPNGEIKISSQVLDDQIVMIIEDNGSGISPGDLQRVKEKFYKGSSMKSGTGLGLSIASEIMELHGGKMLIDSTEGKGTKVVLIMPFFYENMLDGVTEEDKA